MNRKKSAGLAAFRAQTGQGYPYTLADQVQPDLTTTMVIRDLLPRRAIGVIYGDPGDGKTAIAVDMMFHVAGGRDYRSRRVERQPVVYIALEGHGGINNRVAAARDHLGITGAPFALVKAADSFRDPPAAQKAATTALQLMTATSCDNPIVVIDTFTAALGAGGSDCDPADVTAFLENVKQSLLGSCTVLIVHHSGKDRGRGARGWSGLFAACDFELEMGRDDDLRTMAVSKMRDGSDSQNSMCYRLIGYTLGTHAVYGDPVTAVVVEHLSDAGKGKGKRLAPTAQAALNKLWEMIRDQSRSFPLPGQPNLRCVIAQAWQYACEEPKVISRSGEAKDRRRKFYTAQEALIKAGLVIEDGGRVWPAPKSDQHTGKTGDEPDDEPE